MAIQIQKQKLKTKQQTADSRQQTADSRQQQTERLLDYRLDDSFEVTHGRVLWDKSHRERLTVTMKKKSILSSPSLRTKGAI